MPTPTTTYSLSKPTVGGDDNAWGTEINNNLDKLDDLLDGTLSITPNLATGWEVGGVAVTSTAAELNILDGVTASTAEINLLDGVTASTAELNILDGVTATASEINLLDGKTLSGSDTALITGTAGTAGDIVQWDAAGDLVSYGAATQVQATWETGTGTTESLVSPAKVTALVAARVYEDGEDATTSGLTHDFTNIPAGINEIDVFLDSVSRTPIFLSRLEPGAFQRQLDTIRCPRTLLPMPAPQTPLLSAPPLPRILLLFWFSFVVFREPTSGLLHIMESLMV